MQTITFTMTPEPQRVMGEDGHVSEMGMSISIQTFADTIESAEEAGTICAQLSNAFIRGYGSADLD